MTIDLRGHVVVVTGAAQGLGSGYARECAARGAAVLITDVQEGPLRRLADDIGRQGGIARAVPGDVTDPALHDEVVDECTRRWGTVTGWVNNAGIERLQAIDAADPAATELMIRVNLLGTAYGTAAAARVMRNQGTGSIVNVTSGAQHGMRHLAVYGATKGGIASLTYAAAIDMADTAVRVNAISPLANTQMSVDGDRHFSAVDGQQIEVASTLSSPDVIAPIVSFLMSDASRGITGQVIRFDGARLSIVRHPEIDTTSTVTADAWTADTIADAFEASLREALYTTEFASPARPQA
ncbi:MAG TPA: SDR family oxidoreductase [Pseudolysinimonas sp.]|jgi:NAD(P)-dependent dehydrogenase (short-subunit alcohol dehydrogenase family)